MPDYASAATYWTNKEPTSKRIPEAELRHAIEEFIASHRIGALATATADGTFVRNTPIEYDYFDGSFWMFSEGGQKFRALATNQHACLAVFEPNPAFGHLGGMQVTGIATVVEPFSPDYLAACDHKHIDPERLKKLPFTMNLIKLTPTRIDVLESAFKEQGYDSRQWLDLA